MSSVDVVTVENRRAGSVELPAAVFETRVKPDLLHAEVGRSQRATFYQRHGDFACAAALLLVACFSLASGGFRRRRRPFA